MAKKASHAEIWDDSALVTSWNEALADLAARGEKIEIVLDEAENRDGELDASEDAVPGGDMPVDHAPEIQASTTTNGAAPAPTTPPTARQDVPPAAIPQLLLNQGKQSPPTTSYGIGSDCANKSFAVQDEPLKNVMMSWYYAGYYTGLYEGQQKTFAGMQSQGGVVMVVAFRARLGLSSGSFRCYGGPDVRAGVVSRSGAWRAVGLGRESGAVMALSGGGSMREHAGVKSYRLGFSTGSDRHEIGDRRSFRVDAQLAGYMAYHK
ncbi:hypothetical protein LTR91_020650 [Friedmanniomyces endolithicus]|uniref:Survival motor neuron Tudor domain-containing protein n=1 Tax=Friedmanniomyces endolithicus TaxID=329885 RepID=A0AAN6K090_9PEZI|nr:hypothetical protein LTS09_002422 [Friedmanniomyces endolithicus]KAK0353287.1 hypothetical protein LTR94_017262 [Friedmanniomyces endolithicus]KAK0779627.1 hypothetical protein LTR38_014385 [Friedmanniomyces endolithicus]KAK0783364.1 hypothetical protein LTR75_014162 [Friedmanniomyces endolithicus]KAK0806515.1 hypothetical protein LTR59_003592 [Friedmanniomyces endolithicus]